VEGAGIVVRLKKGNLNRAPLSRRRGGRRESSHAKEESSCTGENPKKGRLSGDIGLLPSGQGGESWGKV